MLSYLHAFHAGNYSDVLKHTALVAIVRHLLAKGKSFHYIDTHSGPGVYSLTGGHAQKNREYEGGIGRLWSRNALPELVGDYVNLVKEFQGPGSLESYPGSPWFARHLLRPRDRLTLYERHSTEAGILQEWAEGDLRLRTFKSYGFAGCLKCLPPRERRGLILIDPSYEIKSDYRQVIDTLLKAHRRFATGVYVLWYPVVDRQRIDSMEAQLRTSGVKRVQLYELGVRAEGPGHGLAASGLIVVNPPWTLQEKMTQTLPWLAQELGEEGMGTYRIEQLVEE